MRGTCRVSRARAGKEALRDYVVKTSTRVAGPWADHAVYRGEDLITDAHRPSVGIFSQEFFPKTSDVGILSQEFFFLDNEAAMVRHCHRVCS